MLPVPLPTLTQYHFFSLVPRPIPHFQRCKLKKNDIENLRMGLGTRLSLIFLDYFVSLGDTVVPLKLMCLRRSSFSSSFSALS